MGNYQMEEEKYLCDFDFLAEDVRRRKEKKTEIRIIPLL